MKVIVDVGVGVLVEEQLRELGHDVLAVRDLNPSMPDSEILTHALAEERLVITMDKDFGELVYRRGRLHSGVLFAAARKCDRDGEGWCRSKNLREVRRSAPWLFLRLRGRIPSDP